MVVIVLSAHDISEHTIGLTQCLDHKLSDGLAELFVSLDPKQAPIDYLAVIVTPVVVLLVLAPVPTSDTFPG